MLNGYDFRECNLDSLEFLGKELCDSFWENASTREVQWKQSALRGAVFQNTIMTGDIFKESFL